MHIATIRSVRARHNPPTSEFAGLSVAPGALRNTLIVLMGILYSGLLPFLIFISQYLLYGLYVGILICIALSVLADTRLINNIRAALPYLFWIMLYCLWGTIVSPDKNVVLSDIKRLFLQTTLVLASFAICVSSSSDIRKFSNIVQVVLIVNAFISLWEITHPETISRIAYTLGDSAAAFDEFRPAGLWSNPNEAAFAFLFGLLISYWAGGPLAWLGRMAAISGIYLSVSRSGMYLLLLCGLLYLLIKLKSMTYSLGRVTILVNILTLIALMSTFLFYQADSLNIDLSRNWNMRRILDFTESNSDQATRSEVATIAARYAIDGPWYGYGIFKFQGVAATDAPFRSFLSVGAHNIYLAVWGETGILCAFIYALLLCYGVSRPFFLQITMKERFIFTAMWLSYLLIGLVWHNQFTSVIGMIYVAILFHLPIAAQNKAAPAIDPSEALYQEPAP